MPDTGPLQYKMMTEADLRGNGQGRARALLRLFFRLFFPALLPAPLPVTFSGSCSTPSGGIHNLLVYMEDLPIGRLRGKRTLKQTEIDPLARDTL